MGRGLPDRHSGEEKPLLSSKMDAYLGIEQSIGAIRCHRIAFIRLPVIKNPNNASNTVMSSNCEISMQKDPRSRAAEALLFAKNVFLHPYMLGSIIPSSRYLVRQVLEPIDWNRASVIVEYGPGVGTFTGEILKRMRSDARLIAIETNPEFIQFLRGSFQDPRLHVEHGSAADVQLVLERLGLPNASYIISGIPLGSMPRALQADIVSRSRDALAPGGEFLVYQFTSRVLPVLRRTFQHVRRAVVPRNLPPAQLFVCATDAA
jgi:phospholipid N-methyltransferase